MTRPKHPAHEQADAEATAAERWAQRFAAALGTVHFLIGQTLFIAVWMTLNTVHGWGLMWDHPPFIALNLVFSTQAAYAAPLILLAQRAQERRDRARADHDHEASEENLRLTREIHHSLAGGTAS